MDLERQRKEHLLENQGFRLTGIACSCAVKLLDTSSGSGVPRVGKHYAFVNSISPHDTCLEMEFPIEKGQLLSLQLSSVGGPPFNTSARVLFSCPSLRKGFHFILAKFEEMSEADQQNLVSLLATISRMQKDTAE